MKRWAVPSIALIAFACSWTLMADEAVNGQPIKERVESPDGPPTRQTDPLSGELGGVLIDRTLTIAGKTFFDTFSQQRLNYPILSSVTLTIHERPSARWGSLIWISEGSRIYFQASVSPRLSGIEEIATQAIAIVRERIITQTLSQALQQSKDLADDEL